VISDRMAAFLEVKLVRRFLLQAVMQGMCVNAFTLASPRRDWATVRFEVRSLHGVKEKTNL